MPAEDRPSKSQRKRDMHALQDLGERLLAMQPAKLAALPLPPSLADAIALARTITSREGLRRQRQYIGRLMREVDPGPIVAALDDDGSRHRAEVAVMHAAERWRARMLDDTSAIAEFLRQHPPRAHVDEAALREHRDAAPLPGHGDAAAPREHGAATTSRAPDDAASLRRLVDEARQEVARGEPARRFRELYRHLRDALSEPSRTAFILPENESGEAGARRDS